MNDRHRAVARYKKMQWVNYIRKTRRAVADFEAFFRLYYRETLTALQKMSLELMVCQKRYFEEKEKRIESKIYGVKADIIIED